MKIDRKVFRASAAAAFCGFLVLDGGARNAAGSPLLTNPPEYTGGFGGTVIQPALGELMVHSFPTTPLSKGLFETKVTPAYFTVSKKMGEPSQGQGNYYIDETVKGPGVSVGVLYGFSEHWGMSALAAYAQDKGDISVGNSYVQNLGGPGQVLANNGTASDRGVTLGVNLIYDHFSGENFRLPMMLGVSYLNYSGSAETDINFNATPGHAGHAGLASEQYSNSGVGFTAGLAPQFNTGPFRWVFLIFAAEAVSSTKGSYRETDLTTGQTAQDPTWSDDSHGVEGGGITAVYRPWNVSFTYLAPFLSSGPDRHLDVSVYSLTWTKKWGGETSKSGAEKKRSETKN